MAKEINSYCTICGKGYHLCMSCKDQKDLSPWKIYTDTSEHYKIHQVIVGYQHGVYTKDEAKKKLMSIDLSDIETFKPEVKEIVNEIIGGKSTATTKKVVGK